MKKSIVRTFCVLLLTLVTAGLGAETIHGVVGTVMDPGQPRARSFIVPAQEYIAFLAPEDRLFTTAVELELEIPAAVLGTQNAVGLFVYAGVAPNPEAAPAGGTTHAGETVLVVPLGQNGVERLEILMPGRTEPERSGSHVLRLNGFEDFPLMLGVAPISKGVSESVLHQEYRLSIRRRTIPEGGIRIRFEGADGAGMSASQLADAGVSAKIGRRRLPVGQVDLVEPGFHRVSVESESHLPDQRTVGVQRGEVTDVVFRLQEARPQVRVEAPRSAVVTINGRLVAPGEELYLDPGEHTVVFRVDEVTVSRRFVVGRSGSYTLSLVLDILIDER